MRKKLLSMLILLCLTVSSTWVDAATVTFSYNNTSKVIENVDLPHTFSCDTGGELDLIVKEIYGSSNVAGSCYAIEYHYGYNTSVSETDLIISGNTNAGEIACRYMNQTGPNPEDLKENAYTLNISVTGAPAPTTGSWTSGDCTVTFVNGTLTVSKTPDGSTGNMADYHSSYILPWGGYVDYITSIVIESGVTHIGSYAFYGCDDEILTSITLPASVTSIGTYAFYPTTVEWTVNDGKAVSAGSGEFDITYVREFKVANKWQSLFLPFSIDMREVDADVVFAKVDGVEINGNEFAINIVKASNVEVLPAKTPLFIAARSAGVKNINAGISTVAQAQNDDDNKCSYGDAEFYGMLNEARAGLAGKYIMSGGNLCYVPQSMDNLTLGVFRWYLNLPDGAYVRLDLTDFDADEATSIAEVVANPVENGATYSVSGVQVNGGFPGIYIVNGKKYLMK